MITHYIKYDSNWENLIVTTVDACLGVIRDEDTITDITLNLDEDVFDKLSDGKNVRCQLNELHLSKIEKP